MAVCLELKLEKYLFLAAALLVHVLQELHRVWVDVPEYNEHALRMFRHVGFVLEGHMRKTHRKDGEWYDYYAMGLLVDEYSRRRARLMGTTAV